MEIIAIEEGTPLWRSVADFACSCSWRAGCFLAARMWEGGFTDWERVIVILDGGRIAGYCTVSKTDCIPEVTYTPYVGFIFVDEAYRGKRLSEAMIDYAAGYLKDFGFGAVYLVSDHVGLYEKYGFRVIDRKKAAWGEIEKIYMRELD